MERWSRLVSEVGGERIVVALGVLYVALAVERTISIVAAGGTLTGSFLTFLQVGGPGLALVYGGSRLPRTRLRREAYPRIVAWCLGASLVMAGVVGLLLIDRDITISRPLWSMTLALSIGNLGGFAIGTNEARAITRAREAEEHERRLQRQNDRLESFASMLAHELRNPLNIAQIYLPQVADGDADAEAEVETAHSRIEEMIEILLITARNTDAEIDWESASLADVAETAWDDLPAEDADLVVETDRTVRVDPVHLRHLLENLFRNAVEHSSTNRQPSADAAADEPVTVWVGDLEAEDGEATGGGFYVADDGPGIPAEERPAVFDAGYTTDADGIGLGLTFVAQLADTYDWDCAVTESEAGGARFEFRNVDAAERRERRAN